MRITIKRWGNSAGMVIPNIVMKELNLQPGQSVEAQVWNTPGGKDSLEVPIDHIVFQVAAHLIGEHQIIRVVPRRSHQQAQLILLLLL